MGGVLKTRSDFKADFRPLLHKIDATHLSYTSSAPSSTLPSRGRVRLGLPPPATLSYLQLTMVCACKLCHLSPSSALGRWRWSSILIL